MTSLRSFVSATVVAGAMFALSATAARADARPLFTWTGTVDREAIIVMRGASLETQGDGYDSFRDARYRVTQTVPRAAGIVRVERADGRGDVDVIQQPSQFNGYTTRVRVRDRQSGADRYQLVVVWDGENDVRRGRDDRDRRDNGRPPWWYRGDRDDRRSSQPQDRHDHDDDEDDDDDDKRGDPRNGDRDRRNRRDRDNGSYSGSGMNSGSGTLRFSAAVDDVAEIRIRGRRVEAFARSGRPLYNVRYDISGASLPELALPLDLRRFAGRGNVTIAQYPRAFNDWTAIIRIDDSRAGPDNYEFDLRW